MGCLLRLGCLFVLACAAVVGWFTRDRWMPEKYRARFSNAAPASATWEPLTDRGASRTREALDKLSQSSGPVFQTLSGADVASYVFRELSKQMPSADSIEARVIGERVSMRAVVKTSELGSGLGALGGMLGERERVEMTGTLRVIRPGLGEFQIQEAKVRGLAIPHGMVSTLLGRFARARPEGVSADALPLPLPRYVGDIRVANGKITLYKNVQ